MKRTTPRRKHPFLRILLVEDAEHRYKRFKAWSPADVRLVWARSAGAAIGVLERDFRRDAEHDAEYRPYDGIMLDHDLHEQKRTSNDHQHNGMDVMKVVRRLVDNDVPVFVHSANESGGPKMAHYLRGEGFDVEQVRMGQVTQVRYLSWLDAVRAARAEADEG